MQTIPCVPVSEADYLEATESNTGFCTNCGDFTIEFAEPDARNYHCDDCGEDTGFGAEEALLVGYITIQ